MSVLDIENLSFTYGEQQLYQDASMRLFEGEHACLVGPNGCGKSTLLKLLAHLIKPDDGRIKWNPTKKVGYLDQYAKIKGSLLVKNYLYDVFLPLFEKERLMEDLYQKVGNAAPNDQEKLLNRAASLGDELLESDFYAIKSKVGDIIHGLGLEMSILDQPIKTLSGGMRAKIILGKLLLEDADVLLLDEPTNFLDVKHIEWLSKFLKNYSKAFLVVSHQESFLESIAETVFAIETGKITRYKGNYQFYLTERELRFEQQQKAFKSQQKFIKKTEEFIQKNIVRASTTKQAQSRRKTLQKLNRVASPKKSRTYQFVFPFGTSTGKDVLVIKDLIIGYEYPLVDALDLTILKEDKVAITGKNGVGKSTFIKTILNELMPISGSYHWIDTAKISYFEQESHLPKDLTAFQIVHNEHPSFEKKEVMTLLAQHGINFDMANRLASTLSGGEQTKIRLALLRHQKSNVLIMDEPTNHLDQNAKDALKQALIDYQGTLILVSHETEFYQDICDYEIALIQE